MHDTKMCKNLSKLIYFFLIFFNEITEKPPAFLSLVAVILVLTGRSIIFFPVLLFMFTNQNNKSHFGMYLLESMYILVSKCYFSKPF